MKKRNTLLFQRQTQFSCQIIRLGQEFKKMGLVRYKKKALMNREIKLSETALEKLTDT